MIIILEGNECCFKTTIANKVSKKLNFPIIKGSSFELSQCTNEELFKRFKEFAKMDNVIFDRFIYSNLVYASLYQDYSILNEQQVKEIEDLIKYKAKLFYFFADDQMIRERLQQRGDDYVEEDMISKISEKYIKVIMKSALHKTSYDTGEWSSDEIVEDIVKRYEQNN
jgi:thymidylate kinase